MQDLRIAAISLDIKPGDKLSNLQALEKALHGIEKNVDLILLPELFTTGFMPDKPSMSVLAETNGGDTISLLHNLADKYNMAFVGSFLAKTASTLYNRAFFIEPMGDETFYDKRHLFSIGTEPEIVAPGHDVKAIVRFRGWNIAVIICYDLRFPIACRNVGNEYDLLVVSANWPRSREYAWSHLLKARAIENQAYVVGINRSGSDQSAHYDDMTAIIDYKGKALEHVTHDNQICYATLDKPGLERWRHDFPVWRDSDSFTII